MDSKAYTKLNIYALKPFLFVYKLEMYLLKSLKDGNFELEEFLEQTPPYAIFIAYLGPG